MSCMVTFCAISSGADELSVCCSSHSSSIVKNAVDVLLDVMVLLSELYARMLIVASSGCSSEANTRNTE
jgi:hypothetical protein